GWREGRGPGAGRSMGRNGTIFGSGFFVPGASGVMVAAGFITAGSSGGGGGAATTVGSARISGSGTGTNAGSGTTSGAGTAGLGFTIVAAGLISAGVSPSSVLTFFARPGFFGAASAAASPSSFGLATRFGLGASGSSRP